RRMQTRQRHRFKLRKTRIAEGHLSTLSQPAIFARCAGLKILTETADQFHVLCILWLVLALAFTAQADRRSDPRSERRDQAQGERRNSHPSARSSSARREFQRLHPCPATGLRTGACPGYVIDHIVPLKRGGRDEPSNMQWQTIAEAKAKDRLE